MKKYRFLLITLGVLIVVVVALAAVIVNFRQNQSFTKVGTVSDGAGGAIVAWQNDKGIYVRHLDSSGKLLWQQGDLEVSEGTGTITGSMALYQTGFSMVSDGLGGAIIAWAGESAASAKISNMDNFNPLNIYVQRIGADGALMWPDTAIGAGDNWQIVATGDGGAVIAWDNFKPYAMALRDDYLYLQKIALDGIRLWGNTGLSMVMSSPFHTSASGNVDRSLPTYTGTQDIVSDGSGGAIFIWDEEEAGGSNRVFAQRVDNQGNPAWSGTILVGNGTYQSHSLITDGSGGAFLALQAYNQGVTFRVQVGHDGGLMGVTPYYPYSVGDGSGGSINCRIQLVQPNAGSGTIYDTLYVQRLDAAGSPVWPEKKVISSRLGYEIINLQCTADGSGGILMSWHLVKGETARGVIYVQKADASGNLLFGTTGINVFGSAGTWQWCNTVSDGDGGLFVTASTNRNKIFIQHISSGGSRLWGSGIRLDK
jgi:hypothetical protein